MAETRTADKSSPGQTLKRTGQGTKETEGKAI